VTVEKPTCMSQILPLIFAFQKDSTILRFQSHAWNIFYSEDRSFCKTALLRVLCLYSHQYLKIHSKCLKNRMLLLRIAACTLAQRRTQEFFFAGGGGGSTNSIEDRGQRERGSGGGSPLFRGSGGSCNLVQEISFHVVTFS
jgi:hypothetical protein